MIQAKGIHTMRMRLFSLVALIGFLQVTGIAQTFRGTILGTVTDQTGAAISGAKVTIRNTETGQTRETSTTGDGSFRAPELALGDYTVTVEKVGFKTAVSKGVKVDVATDSRVDAVLQAGEVATTVEVQGDVQALVETSSDTMGGVIDSIAAENLPVNGRDYTKLIYLVPGVAGSPDMITDSPGSFGTFSVNGARGRANNFLLDGTDMNDGYRNDPAINEAGVFGTPATILPVEAVAEIRVLSNFEPEFGRNAGGVINIVTKSGTNEFHGSLLEFVRNTDLDARNFFNFKPEPQSPFHNNQFGGSLGGPIVKDKTFFFADYEGQREVGALNSLSCVPEPAMLAQATNPVIVNLLKLNPYPAPNLPNQATDTGCPNGPDLSANVPFRNRVDSAIAKLDHNFNAKNILTGRYYFGDSTQIFPLALVGGGTLPQYNTYTPTRVQLVSLSLVTVLSPNSVNEVRVGWIRFAEGFLPQDYNFNPNSIGIDNGVTSPFDYGLPVIDISGFAQVGASSGDPRDRVDSNWHLIDNVSKRWGQHDIKFGYEFRRTTVSQNFDRNFRGTIDFSDVDSFLSGQPDGGVQVSGYTNRNTYENNHGVYIQDAYRVSSRLTLNMGLRWDYYGVIGEKRGLFTNWDFATDSVVPTNQLYLPDYHNFGPRMSLAYDVFGKGKTVLRTGWGIFYDAFSQDFFMGHLPYAPSFDPGPAYSGIGPAAISFASETATTIQPGVDIFGAVSPMYNVFGVDRHMRTPYMENYNFNLQQVITNRITLQVAYVGSEGHKLFRFRDLNQPTQAEITAADLANGVISYGVPRIYSNYYTVLYQEASADSNYNSMQTSLRLHGFHGLQSTLNYSWSHSLDNASDGEDFTPNQAQPNNSFNEQPEWGNSSFDIRHRFTGNFIYEFPKTNGRHKMLTDGWGINGVATLQTGQPFQLNYNFEGDYDGSGNGFGRPDVVGPAIYNQSNPFQFLNLSSFTVPCTLNGQGTADVDCIAGTRHYGDEARNSLVGPNFRNLDFSIFKQTPIGEHATLEFRAECYNIFNHPNFTNPELPLFIADAAPNGINPNGTGAGYLALSATPDVSVGNPYLGGGGPRGIQLGLKLRF